MSISQSKRFGIVKGYHEETKHHPHRYARSLGYMDWDNQPVPFRIFEEAPQIQLPLSNSDRGLPYSALYAHFDSVLMETPSMYPRLFWETGLVGQVLYLEAEAQYLRATGIGCFFDDEMHGILGLKGSEWQSLYHFTVGKHVDDARLETKTPYFHLER